MMNILRCLTLTIATLLATPALAAPGLKADVIVTAPVVTVSDMFDDAGIIAEQGLFRAPLPGTTGTVAIADIRTALSRLGITDFETNGLLSVRVSRAATVVDETTLDALIAADLTARGIVSDGMSVQVRFAAAIAPINAEVTETPASLLSLRYLPGTGGFSARFAIAGFDQPLDLSGTIELMIEAPHITANLPAGTLLAPEDIEMRAVPVRFVESTGVARLEDIVGKSLLRQSRAGMLLKPSDVSNPLLVAKNDHVTIYFRKGPMTLSVKGQAITGAAQGGLVQVLNLMSKRVITARAIAAGAVEVSGDPLAVAGL